MLPLRLAINLGVAFALVCVALMLSCGARAQTAGPNVVRVDDKQFAEVIKPKGKPLLINFWATWCEPCREEFPELVKIDAEYRGRIDFITVSLDFEEELKTGVPKFLAEMKATMPAYLLVSLDETKAISSVSKDWQGGLPFTVLFAADGSIAYSKQGLVKYATLKPELDKTLAAAPASASSASASQSGVWVAADFVKILDGRRDEALHFYEHNWKLYREAAMKRGVIESYELLEMSSEKAADFDLVLITRFKDEAQYRDSEKNFEPILKEIRPNGPSLKNELKPEAFRRNVAFYSGRSLFRVAP